MRIFAIIGMLFALVVMETSLQGQSEAQDPYWINLVSAEMKTNSEGRRVISGWSQKRLVQLGDRISVSILKILDASELRNPQRVRIYLPIIRNAFAQPELISLEADKDPKITIFMLDYLAESETDPPVKQEIQQTLEFVKEKTARQALRPH